MTGSMLNIAIPVVAKKNKHCDMGLYSLKNTVITPFYFRSLPSSNEYIHSIASPSDKMYSSHPTEGDFPFTV